MNKKNSKNSELSVFSGWLLVFIIYLIILILVNMFYIITSISNIYSISDLVLLPALYGKILGLVFFGYIIYVLISLLKKKANAILLTMTFLILMLINVIISCIQKIISQEYSTVVVTIFINSITIFWILYFQRSKRVAMTFVKFKYDYFKVWFYILLIIQFILLIFSIVKVILLDTLRIPILILVFLMLLLVIYLIFNNTQSN